MFTTVNMILETNWRMESAQLKISELQLKNHFSTVKPVSNENLSLS